MSDFSGLPRHYSLQEAAEYLGCTKNTVKSLITRGLLKGKRVGRQIRILADELERFMREDSRKSKAGVLFSSASAGVKISTIADKNASRQAALALARQISAPRGSRNKSRPDHPPRHSSN